MPLNITNNRFIFPNLTINSTGMFILQITVSSDDAEYSITKTSNNIRVVLPNRTYDSNYYYNLQMKFNGTYLEDDRAKYISMVYNYFLTTYNVELAGPIVCYSGGSLMFISGIDGTNANLLSTISKRTVNESREIIQSRALLWFLLGNFEIDVSKASSSLSLPSISSPSSSSSSSLSTSVR